MTAAAAMIDSTGPAVALGNPRTVFHPGRLGERKISYRLGLTAGEAVERRLDACAGIVVTPEASAVLEALLSYQARRRSRTKLRRLVQQFTGLPRLTECGVTSITGTGAPVLRVNGVRAGYAGVSTCGSVWCCPVCAAKIAAHRAEDLATVMRKVLASGGSASLMTFTVRHHKGMSLAHLWDAISKAWNRVTSGKSWLRDQAAGGMLGWVKAVEVTHGHHGWHPHIHVLVCWRDQISEEIARIVAESMHARWSSALAKLGLESWRDRGGLDVRMASLNNNLADYFVKLAREVTSQATKSTKKGRPPFAILADIGTHQLADDGDLWHEWEKSSFRRRQLTWSRGALDLRAFAGLGEELTDEEAAAQELDGDDVLALVPETWGWLVANERTTELLDAAELGGTAGAIEWLNYHHLDWIPAQPAPPPTPAPAAVRERQRELWRPTLYQLPPANPCPDDDTTLWTPTPSLAGYRPPPVTVIGRIGAQVPPSERTAPVRQTREQDMRLP